MKKVILLSSIILLLLIGYIIYIKESTTKINKDFSISSSGFWSGKKSADHHAFDPKLAISLYEFFKKNKAQSILDLGAGQGRYSQYFMSNGIFTSCYDGNPDTQGLSDGVCGVINLAKPINFSQYDWVLSLEVGEHIPKKYEDIFISNINKLNRSGIILSWAVPGQGGDGHVNEQDNQYIKQKFTNLGYVNDVEAENKLRQESSIYWFKNTIMVFRKN